MNRVLAWVLDYQEIIMIGAETIGRKRYFEQNPGDICVCLIIQYSLVDPIPTRIMLPGPG